MKTTRTVLDHPEYHLAEIRDRHERLRREAEYARTSEPLAAGTDSGRGVAHREVMVAPGSSGSHHHPVTLGA